MTGHPAKPDGPLTTAHCGAAIALMSNRFTKGKFKEIQVARKLKLQRETMLVFEKWDMP
jgi:hypothetical protein